MAELHTALADGLSSVGAPSALARLFVGEKSSPEVVWFSLPGGRTLYRAGEDPDHIYLVRAGRLGVIRKGVNGQSQFLGVIKPGEPAGEMALIAGTPHSSTVVAMRDSEVLALPRHAFFAAARRDPALMAELARLMIIRARQPVSTPGMAAPRVLGFIGASDGPSIRPLVETIERSLQALGYSVAVLGAEAEHAPTEWFSTVEQRHDFVLFTADHGESAWIHLCARQVDRLMLVGRSGQTPSFDTSDIAGRALRDHRLFDLLLVYPADARRPDGAAAWLDVGQFSRHFNIRENHAEDAGRIARTLCGASVGLVLSGGGARAYAHIGAIQALREAGEPIDFVGGTSMGAIIGAGLAMEWPQEEIVQRIRRAFVDSSPLSDIAFPMIAMTRGRVVRDRLEENFGEALIEDLWRPFFCVSSNLTTGEPHVHERGKLKQALRASASLPGVMPPQIEDGAVLVDGAVTNNLPVDIMRRWHRGAVVGVDVAEESALRPQDVHEPKSLLRWLASGQWRRGPPIVALLIRTATVSSTRSHEELSRYADLLVAPVIAGVGVQDWRAFDGAVEAGYQATAAALQALERPLTKIHGIDANDDGLEMHI